MKWIIIILVLTSIVLLYLSNAEIWPFNQTSNSVQIENITPTPTLTQEQVKGVKQELENIVSRTLPTDAEQATLRDVSGQGAQGFATRKFENQQFELTILADLPSPQPNNFYQAWLVKGQPDQEDFNLISLGKLNSRKGGWILDFTSNLDLTDHQGLVVTLETTDDQTPETHILEGNF